MHNSSNTIEYSFLLRKQYAWIKKFSMVLSSIQSFSDLDGRSAVYSTGLAKLSYASSLFLPVRSGKEGVLHGEVL